MTATKKVRGKPAPPRKTKAHAHPFGQYGLGPILVSKPILFVGIDPGKTGAIAAIDKNLEVYFLTLYPEGEVGASNIIRTIQRSSSKVVVFIEDCTINPKFGKVQCFKMGINFGIWRGVVAGANISFILEKPKVWQKGLLRSDDGVDTKKQSLAAAERIFPNISIGKNHNKSDALLMAYYMSQKMEGTIPSYTIRKDKG